MSRVIKFRAWHSKKEKMFSAEKMAGDQLTLLPTGQFINVHGGSTHLSRLFGLSEMLPLQFTGLQDKNGKDIYEGDVLKKHCLPQQGVVEFEDGHFVVNYGDQSNFIAPRNVFEIIGNRFENPELLEALTND